MFFQSQDSHWRGETNQSLKKAEETAIPLLLAFCLKKKKRLILMNRIFTNKSDLPIAVRHL